MQPTNSRSNLSQHILPNSSMMIGVCMTVISIIKVVGIHNGQHSIAELLAINSLIFMASALLSYFSMRDGITLKSSMVMEKIADIVFMVGLLFMTGAGFVLAYEMF